MKEKKTTQYIRTNRELQTDYGVVFELKMLIYIDIAVVCKKKQIRIVFITFSIVLEIYVCIYMSVCELKASTYRIYLLFIQACFH